MNRDLILRAGLRLERSGAFSDAEIRFLMRHEEREERYWRRLAEDTVPEIRARHARGLEAATQ